MSNQAAQPHNQQQHQKVLTSQLNLGQPTVASLDLQSQLTNNSSIHSMIDQMSSLFELFAQYFDRRFFELQEFMYHFNKAVLTTNKNFTTIQTSIPQLKNSIGIDILQPFKQRKDEKRLSDELREHIKQIYNIREDLMRFSSNSLSLNTAQTSSQNVVNSNTSSNNSSGLSSNKSSAQSKKSQSFVQTQSTQNQNIAVSTQNNSQQKSNLAQAQQNNNSSSNGNNFSNLGSQNTTTLASNRSQQQLTEPKLYVQHLSPTQTNSQFKSNSKAFQSIDSQDPMTHFLPLQQLPTPIQQSEHPNIKNILYHQQNQNQQKEESEVQDDSDQELKRQIFTGTLISVNNQKMIQRPGTTMATTSTYGDEDSQGETVLIGDDDPSLHLQTETYQRTGNSLGGKKSNTKSARSPPQKTIGTKIQQHSKHKANKKSPMGRDPKNLTLNHSSRITSDQLINNDSEWIGGDGSGAGNSQLSMTIIKNDQPSKSPFNYTQKTSSSQTRYNEIQNQKNVNQNKTPQNQRTHSKTSTSNIKSKTSRQQQSSSNNQIQIQTINITQANVSNTINTQNSNTNTQNNPQITHSSYITNKGGQNKSKSPAPSLQQLKEQNYPQNSSQPQLQNVSSMSKNMNIQNFQSSRNNAIPQQHNSLTEQSQKLQNFQSVQASNFNSVKQQSAKVQTIQPQIIQITQPPPSFITNELQNLEIGQTLIGSSGGSSSKQHLDSIQPQKKIQQQTYQQPNANQASGTVSNSRHSLKPDTVQQSPMLSHKSSIISEDEKILDKHIRNLDTSSKNVPVANIQQIPKTQIQLTGIDESLVQSRIFEQNLEKLTKQMEIIGETGGQFDDQFNAHRLTLQGDMVSASADELPRLLENYQNSLRQSLNKNQKGTAVVSQDNPMRFSDMKEIQSVRSSQQNPHLNPHHRDIPQISIMDENLFMQNAQFLDIDLSQYNSPSFAAGNHLGSNHLLALAQRNSLGINHYSSGQQRNASSSSGRDSDALQLPAYEQKIILHNSVIKKTQRTAFLKLPGYVLAIIGDYLNEKLPLFIFTNRISFKISLQFQIEHYESQRQIILGQVYQIHRELERMQNTSKFDLSQQSQEEYELLSQKDWDELILVCKRHGIKQENVLKQKNIIILRLYLTFMGLDLAEEQDDYSFLEQCSDFMKDCGSQIAEVMDPEKSFLISEENKKRIKELLVNLQKEKLIEDETKSDGDMSLSQDNLESRAQHILETFTNLLFEALQFVNIIPNVLVQDMKQEMDELRKVAEAFNGIKNNLIDFKNLVA